MKWFSYGIDIVLGEIFGPRKLFLLTTYNGNI